MKRGGGRAGQGGFPGGGEGPPLRKGCWPLLAAGADTSAIIGSCGPVHGF